MSTASAPAQVPPIRLYIFISLIFFLILEASHIAIVQFGPDTDRAAAADGIAPDQPAAGRTGARAHERIEILFLQRLRPSSPAAERAAADPEAAGRPGGWRAAVSAGFDRAVSDPARLNRAIDDLFPKMMVVLVPLFGLILALLYVRQRRYLVEHLVFALHVHAFLFLLLSLFIAGTAWLGLPALPWWSFFGPATLYLLVALRRVYRQGWIRSGGKALLLIGLYGTVFMAALTGLLLVGLGEV